MFQLILGMSEKSGTDFWLNKLSPLSSKQGSIQILYLALECMGSVTQAIISSALKTVVLKLSVEGGA